VTKTLNNKNIIEFLRERLQYLLKLQKLLESSYQYHAEINYEVYETEQKIKELEEIKND
jgi:hypothetical protein